MPICVLLRRVQIAATGVNFTKKLMVHELDGHAVQLLALWMSYQLSDIQFE